MNDETRHHDRPAAGAEVKAEVKSEAKEQQTAVKMEAPASAPAEKSNGKKRSRERSKDRQSERDRHRRGDRSKVGGGSSSGGSKGGVYKPRSRPECRVYISNIPYEYRWQDLKDLFRNEGVLILLVLSGKAVWGFAIQFKISPLGGSYR